MEMVLSSKVTIGRVEPLLSPNMKVDWFNKSADTTIVRNAEECDMAFFISRHFGDGIRTGWTNFNKVKSMVDPPLTTVWHMPIIQAPGKRKKLPVLMTLPPVPEASLELISCGCTTACVNARCKCGKSRLPCAM